MQLKCLVVGEVTLVFNSGSSLVSSVDLVARIDRDLRNAPDEKLLRVLLYDGFLIHEFRTPRKCRYPLTAQFAKKLMGTGGGLMYPSVQSHGAINLAVRAEDFDSIFEVLGTQVLEVKKLAFGVYNIDVKRSSCDFDSSGTINWASKKVLSYTMLPGQGMRVANDFGGWRVPLPTSNQVPPPG